MLTLWRYYLPARTFERVRLNRVRTTSSPTAWSPGSSRSNFSHLHSHPPSHYHSRLSPNYPQLPRAPFKLGSPQHSDDSGEERRSCSREYHSLSDEGKRLGSEIELAQV